MSMLRPIDRLLLRNSVPVQPIKLVERLKAIELTDDLSMETITKICAAFFYDADAWFRAIEGDKIWIRYENHRLGVLGGVIRPGGRVGICLAGAEGSHHNVATSRDLVVLLCQTFVRDSVKAEACVRALQNY